MHIFRFKNTREPTLMEDGEPINGIDSIMWVERYREAGEFTIQAKASSGLREALPLGSYISHTDTSEIMIVENHEINDQRGQEAELTITGRGFETILDSRVVGASRQYPVLGEEASDYILPASTLPNQVVVLIRDHIIPGYTMHYEDGFMNLALYSEASGGGNVIERTVRLGSLYDRVMELLSVEDLGIRVVRPGIMGHVAVPVYQTGLIIHNGVNRAQDVIFSYDTCEIDSADYLWSIKRLKTTAIVRTRWVQASVSLPSMGSERRSMFVDATDIDSWVQTAPGLDLLQQILVAAQQRGLDALAAQKEVAIGKVDVAPNSTELKYRTHFNVGDYVTFVGEYDESAIMRVSEYVEIEDHEGYKGYPTLSVI